MTAGTVDLSKAQGNIDSSMGSTVEVPWVHDGQTTRVRWAPDHSGKFMKLEKGAWMFMSPEELQALRAAVIKTNGPASPEAREFYSALMRATKPN